MNVVLDNIIFSLQKSGGGSVYWYELISRMIKTKNNIIFLEQKSTLKNGLRNNLKIDRPIKKAKLPIVLERYLPIWLSLDEITIFHSSYYRFIISKKAITITTIHDFTSEYFSTGIARKINYYQKKIAIMRSDGIICISENTKKDLLKFHPWASKKKISVIYNGVGDSYYKIDPTKESIVKDKELNKIINVPYVLYVGHRTSYKNFNIAVKAVSGISTQYHFVIVGEPLNKNEELLLGNYFQKNDFTVLSGKNNEILNLLYNKAHCLLYPSSYEGFGIPILEAMRAGCPVVTTNKSSIPEVAGDAAIMVDEISATNFKDAINCLSNEEIRFSLIEKGYRQSEKFSWDKTFDGVNNFYQRLYDSKQI